MVNMDELSSKLLEELIRTKNELDGTKRKVGELEGSLPFRAELASEELPFEAAGNEIRVRIQSPGKFNSESFRRKPFPPASPKPGIFVIYGCPKGKWSGGRCQVGMQIQALRFLKDKGWTADKVRAYLKAHNFKIESSLEEMRTGEALEKSMLESKPLNVKGIVLQEGRWQRFFYPRDELERAAETLSGKPIVVDHGKGVRDIVGQVIRSWWDKDKELVRFEGEILCDDIKVLIKRGLVHFTSPGSDFMPVNTEHGLTATNITFYELALTTHPAYANGIQKTLSDTDEYPYRRPEIKGNGEQMGKDGKKEELEAGVKPAPGATGAGDSSSSDSTTDQTGTVIKPGETGTTTTGDETGTGGKPTVTGVDAKALEEKIAGLEAKVGGLTKELEDAKATKKAEEEAKVKAEGEAKKKAEEEAKVMEEAKNKEEAETKARVEAEAKTKEEAEAKVKAEAEAKTKTEAEAKAKAEAEKVAKEAAEKKVREEVVTPSTKELDVSKMSAAELLIVREKRRGHVAES